MRLILWIPLPLILMVATALASGGSAPQQVERWDVFELTLTGPSDGNPFMDTELSVTFTQADRSVTVEGFYDGDGVYKVRFMPDTEGTWTYHTASNRPELDGAAGELMATAPAGNNHGPVTVWKDTHFAYADGARYFSFGTTCYAWTSQPTTLQDQTVQTLREAPFNKIRMSIFPKRYAYNRNEPENYPYVLLKKGKDYRFDWERYDVACWRNFERRVGQLRDMGIQADIILFHPYDRWGFETMPMERNKQYLRYMIARLGAYRNVWWSMANEWDFMNDNDGALDREGFDEVGRFVRDIDPYNRLRGIHNGGRFFDHSKDWITHCSIQSHTKNTDSWRRQYNKPIVVDECQYEGNVPQGWGRLSGQEMVNRFWDATVKGGYAGHGETLKHPDDILWWAKGGALRGESPPRIAFLRQIIQEGPHGEMTFERIGRGYAMNHDDAHYLVYFWRNKPDRLKIDLEGEFKAEVIDAWNMTLTPLEETFSGSAVIPLPAKDYMGLRLTKVD